MKKLLTKKEIIDIITKQTKDFYWTIRRFYARVEEKPREIKWFLQKIFRKAHVSDCELWNLDFHLARSIYPKLKMFVKMKKAGYPMAFSEHDPSAWTKTEYNKAKKNGEVIGGGPKMWDKYLNEMLFAFAWTVVEGDDVLNIDEQVWVYKEIKKWYKDKIKKLNAKQLLKEEDKEFRKKLDLLKQVKFGKKFSISFPIELEVDIDKRASEGMKLFGKFFWSLWD